MDVVKVIELWTGIPATKIQESDLVKLANLENEIKKLEKYKISGRNMPNRLEFIKMGNRRIGPFCRFKGILSLEKQVVCV